MGLLDDAIREHLELKRKHGADPEEVARQEQRGARRPGSATSSRSPTGRPASRAAEEPPEPAEPEAEAPTSLEPPARVDEPPGAASPEPGGAARGRGAGLRRGPVARRRARRGARPTRRSSSARGAPRRRRRGRGRARGDARVPPGDAGARPPVVRAEAAARLRLGQVVVKFRAAAADNRGCLIPRFEASDAATAKRGPQCPGPRFAASAVQGTDARTVAAPASASP